MNTIGAGEFVVGLGDCRVAGAPHRFLVTYGLGSCVALVMYDWRKRAGGLLHVMMPDSSIEPSKAARLPFAYVDTAVPRMLHALEKLGVSRRRSHCSIVGGATMIAGAPHFEIGKRNVLALRRSLWKAGVFVDCEDIGGNESRSVRLDLATGGVVVRKGASPEFALVEPAMNLFPTGAIDANPAG